MSRERAKIASGERVRACLALGRARAKARLIAARMACDAVADFPVELQLPAIDELRRAEAMARVWGAAL